MTTPWSNLQKPNQQDQQDRPRILIGIPYNGKWDPEWVVKTFIPLCYFPTSWCEKFHLLSRVPSLPLARDILAVDALGGGKYKYIFFLDTDMIFEQPEDPNVALNMLYQAINKDPSSKEGKIVSGLYRAKQPQGFNWAMWLDAVDENGKKGFASITDWTGNWIKPDVVGLGCCLIDVDVFRNIPRPYFHWELKDDMSEDFYFCKLAKKYGYTTHVFSDVRLSHLGNLKVKSDGSFAIPLA